MNLGNLATRLKRDIQRSPKKAAVLGLLAVVAIWFWAPLVMKWFGADSESQTPVANAPDISANTSVVAFTEVPKEAASTTKTEAHSRPWNELLAWIDEERLTKPAALAASFVDPFGHPPAQQQEGIETDEEKAQRELGPIDPRQLGLVLNSTVIGPTSRLASINGHICPLEAEIIVTPSGLTIRERGARTAERHQRVESPDNSRKRTPDGREYATSAEAVIGYQLTEIQPTHVTLSRGTRSYRIDLKKFESNGHSQTSVNRKERRDG